MSVRIARVAVAAPLHSLFDYQIPATVEVEILGQREHLGHELGRDVGLDVLLQVLDEFGHDAGLEQRRPFVVRRRPVVDALDAEGVALAHHVGVAESEVEAGVDHLDRRLLLAMIGSIPVGVLWAVTDKAMILPDVISKEPLGPVVRQGDDAWFNVVRWAFFAMVNAASLPGFWMNRRR